MALVRIRFGCDQHLMVNADVAADVLLNHVRATCAQQARKLLSARAATISGEIDAYARRKASTLAAAPPRRQPQGDAADPQNDPEGEPLEDGAEDEPPNPDDARESLLSKLEEALSCRQEQLATLQAALLQCDAIADKGARVDLVQDGTLKGLAEAGTASALNHLTPMTELQLALLETDAEGVVTPQTLTFDIPSDDALVRVD